MDRWKGLGLLGLVLIVALIVAVQLTQREPETGTDEARVTQAGQAAPAGRETRGAAGPDTGGAAAQSRVYAVDPARSELYWRIYRAGVMARLGHNHIISAEDFSGTVSIGDDPAAAEWRLSIPVQSLVVDDPGIRARYGDDFSSEPSEDDIAGTKQNMLSEDVLNGAAYAEIRLTGTGFTGTLAGAMLPAEIELLGRTVSATLPAVIEIEDDTLTVSGEFQFTHQELGMEPFTVLGGAVSVGEEIDFTYRIQAEASTPPR